MEDWELTPARDLHLAGMDRYRSPQREGGLVESTMRLLWWLLLRTTFRTWNRLKIVGQEHLPAQPSFVLIANHASHLDAPLLTSLLPLKCRDCTFPIAARDVFFERLSLAAFSAMFVNAMPVVRGNSGRHGLMDVRERLLSEPSILILFPEGTRTLDGRFLPARSGIGLTVIKSQAPVVPVRLFGTFEAYGKDTLIPRPRKIMAKYGMPMDFAPQRAEAKTCSKARLKEIYQEVADEIMAQVAKLEPCEDKVEFP